MNPMMMGMPAGPAAAPQGMDMMALLQMLNAPMEASENEPMSPQEAALAQIMTNGGMKPPTTAQTPDMLMLLKLLAGMGGGGMGGMPMGGGAGMMPPAGGVPPMY